MRKGLCFGGREGNRKGYWRFSVSEQAQRAAPPVANIPALKYELKLSLKPGGGKYCLFSDMVFDRKVVDCPVLTAKAALPIGENMGEIKYRLASLPGRRQNCNGTDLKDTWGNADHYVSGKLSQEFPWLINILPAWRVWVMNLLTYAKHAYFITCLCHVNENYSSLWL